jgi:hypothetical protein
VREALLRRVLPRRIEHLREAEVEHLDERRAVRPSCHEDVRGLEIAVEDALRVRLEDGVARLEEVLHHLADGQRAALARDLAQVLPDEVLHHEERGAGVGGADVQHARHVLAVERGHRLRLAEEALGRAGDGRRLRQEQLDRHRATQAFVLRGEHAPHAARAEHALDAVLASDPLTGPRHVGGGQIDHPGPRA